MLAAGTAASLFLGSTGWGVFAALLLLLSLEGFFLPTRYFLDETGLEIRRVFSRSTSTWDRFRTVREDAHGLTLSPFSGRSLLEPYRSFRLLFDGGDREAIRRIVREKTEARSGEPGPIDRTPRPKEAGMTDRTPRSKEPGPIDRTPRPPQGSRTPGSGGPARAAGPNVPGRAAQRSR